MIGLFYTGDDRMHVWPLLKEALLGPFGIALIVWIVSAALLARLRRVWPLVIFLAASALFLILVGWQAYEISGRQNPDRAVPFILDGLFVASAFGALLCIIFAALLLLRQRNKVGTALRS